jgi:glycosyltransferase involved in cell wall biosynthesis
MPLDSPTNSPTPGLGVSVVIPCFKQARFLAAAIESALKQTVGGVQVIVVDDGSPDDTAEVAMRFGDRITFIDQVNSGVGAARNAGFARATGEFVIFLDADDCLLPEFAATHLAAMKQQNGDVTCSGWRQVDAEDKVLHLFDAPSFAPDAFHALLPTNLCPPLCYMFKRSSVAAVGAFDPDRRLSGHADWDICLRLAASGAKFVVVPAVLASYRIHPNSLSSHYAGMYDSGLAVLEKARASHGHCAKCGTRFEDSIARFNDEYMRFYLRPALKSGIFARKNRPVLKHFLSRSIGRPSLALAMARRLWSSAFRRLTSSAQKSATGPLTGS